MLTHYHYDDLSYFKYFRISANAIYPFQNNGNILYLRLTPIEETSLESLQSEIDLLNQLMLANVPCVRVVKSKDNRDFIEEDGYYGLVFEKVPGVKVEELEMCSEVAFAIGKSLGQLHLKTKDISTHMRGVYEQIDWMNSTLFELGDHSKNDHLLNLKIKLKELEGYPMGIIHYDFEPDNLFYDEGTIYPIDFNDAMIHFYEMDIINTLDALEPSFHQIFMDGYQSVNDKVQSEKVREFCYQFKTLYTYTRIKRAINEEPNEQPDWMVQLIEKLKKRL